MVRKISAHVVAAHLIAQIVEPNYVAANPIEMVSTQMSSSSMQNIVNADRKFNVSLELSRVLGPGPFTRAEISSRFWAYLKLHGLIDSTQGGVVNTDANLKALFGKDQILLTEMAGLVSHHLH